MRPRRGGILFEVVLAVALFAGAAAFTLAAVRSVFTGLDQTKRQQEAVDLARSKLAELEAGLINLADLRGGTTTAAASSSDPGRVRAREWTFDIKTSRTRFTDLSLVELTVRQAAPGELNPATCTLRQLMTLRETDAEPYELDELIEGLTDG